MLILPQHQYRILRRKPLHEWREPSQRRTLGGIENRTWFSLTARTSDGVRFWRGWFEDWADADAFLWALTVHCQTGAPIPRDIRRLPQASSLDPKTRYWDGRGDLHTFQWAVWFPALYEGEWREEWAELPLVYEKLAVTDFLTSPTGSNQTWNSPSDWNNSDNTIYCVGGGGSGGRAQGAARLEGAGGGGGCMMQALNFQVASPGTTTATYQIGAGHAGSAGTGSQAGTAGGISWFNDTSNPGAGSDATKCSADDGNAGGASSAANGGQGGQTSASWGTSGFNGGNGGGCTAGPSSWCGSGAGGAGGTTGDGANGDTATSTVGSAGGAGGATNGGSAGAADGGSAGAGTAFEGTHGAGGGGGGRQANSGTAGAGGLYGGGGGGVAANSGTLTSGAGRQGLIVVVYTPAVAAAGGRGPLTRSRLIYSALGNSRLTH